MANKLTQGIMALLVAISGNANAQGKLPSYEELAQRIEILSKQLKALETKVDNKTAHFDEPKKEEIKVEKQVEYPQAHIGSSFLMNAIGRGNERRISIGKIADNKYIYYKQSDNSYSIAEHGEEKNEYGWKKIKNEIDLDSLTADEKNIYDFAISEHKEIMGAHAQQMDKFFELYKKTFNPSAETFQAKKVFFGRENVDTGACKQTRSKSLNRACN